MNILGFYALEEVILYDKARKDDEIILVEHPGIIGRLFGKKPRKRTFFGSCTVWHCAETGARQSTSMESILCDWWSQERYYQNKK